VTSVDGAWVIVRAITWKGHDSHFAQVLLHREVPYASLQQNKLHSRMNVNDEQVLEEKWLLVTHISGRKMKKLEARNM
jgi:hypothetical protein